MVKYIFIIIAAFVGSFFVRLDERKEAWGEWIEDSKIHHWHHSIELDNYMSYRDQALQMMPDSIFSKIDIYWMICHPATCTDQDTLWKVCTYDYELAVENCLHVGEDLAFGLRKIQTWIDD